MAGYIQADFRGGTNLFDEDIALGDNEYSYLFNLRNRTTALKPIKLPLEDTTAPTGKKQGIYAFDNYLLLFCAGRAYFKNVVTDSAWTQIENLSLDTSVDYIYTEAVPASTINFSRELIDPKQISGTSTNPVVNLTGIVINGSVSGLIVQDGISQPWIILPDASARKLQTYEEWTMANREYVPIMKQMCFHNGILFGIDPNGTSILRSVSGRPLDFVVNVKQNGDKGGKADTVSHSVGFDPITFLGALNSGELIVATAKTCHPLELNYERTIFAEPTFRNPKPFSAGVVNQFSFVDIGGDYGFIDFDGMRSFNAVNQLTNEGRSSVFSARIQAALAQKQTNLLAATSFDNFSFFALDTLFGNAIGVYDNIRQQWVGFDDYNLDEQFKMFAVANQGTQPFLYGITENKIYKLFAGTNYATSEVRLKALIANDPKNQIRLQEIYAVFTENTIAGQASITEIANGTVGATVTNSLEVKPTQNQLFPFKSISPQCFKTQAKISWNTDGKLLIVSVGVMGQTQKVPVQQSGKIFNESNNS